MRPESYSCSGASSLMHPGRHHPTQAHAASEFVARVGGGVEAGFAARPPPDSHRGHAWTRYYYWSGQVLLQCYLFRFDGVHQRPFCAGVSTIHQYAAGVPLVEVKETSFGWCTHRAPKPLWSNRFTVSRSVLPPPSTSFHYRGPYRRGHRNPPSICLFHCCRMQNSADQKTFWSDRAGSQFADCDLCPHHINPTSPVIGTTNTSSG